jgi:hypothetical protein
MQGRTAYRGALSSMRVAQFEQGSVAALGEAP